MKVFENLVPSNDPTEIGSVVFQTDFIKKVVMFVENLDIGSTVACIGLNYRHPAVVAFAAQQCTYDYQVIKTQIDRIFAGISEHSFGFVLGSVWKELDKFTKELIVTQQFAEHEMLWLKYQISKICVGMVGAQYYEDVVEVIPKLEGSPESLEMQEIIDKLGLTKYSVYFSPTIGGLPATYIERDVCKTNKMFQSKMSMVTGVTYSAIKEYKECNTNLFFNKEKDELRVISLPTRLGYETFYNDNPEKFLDITVSASGARIIKDPSATDLSFYRYTGNLNKRKLTSGGVSLALYQEV